MGQHMSSMEFGNFMHTYEETRRATWQKDFNIALAEELEHSTTSNISASTERSSLQNITPTARSYLEDISVDSTTITKKQQFNQSFIMNKTLLSAPMIEFEVSERTPIKFAGKACNFLLCTSSACQILPWLTS
jgi:hypothetical protein